MEVRKSRTCEKCKQSVPLDKVKLYPRDNERNWLVCENCCEILKNKGVKNVLPKPKPVTNQPKPILKDAKTTSPAAVSTKKDSIGKEQMFCARCKYAFFISPEKAVLSKILTCPYCGKTDKIFHQKSGIQVTENDLL